jgi:hypothetical protein
MLYDPIPKSEPVSRHKLICNKARIVDGYNQEGEQMQILRTPDNAYYSGPVAASKHAKAFRPVRRID